MRRKGGGGEQGRAGQVAVPLSIRHWCGGWRGKAQHGGRREQEEQEESDRDRDSSISQMMEMEMEMTFDAFPLSGACLCKSMLPSVKTAFASHPLCEPRPFVAAASGRRQRRHEILESATVNNQNELNLIRGIPLHHNKHAASRTS